MSTGRQASVRAGKARRQPDTHHRTRRARRPARQVVPHTQTPPSRSRADSASAATMRHVQPVPPLDPQQRPSWAAVYRKAVVAIGGGLTAAIPLATDGKITLAEGLAIALAVVGTPLAVAAATNATANTDQGG